MGTDFIPDDKFVPDEPSPQTSAVDKSAASGFIPDDKFAPDDEKDHSTIPQKALTYYEGLAHGFAGPVATAAEAGLSKLGVPGLSPEEQEARAKENPYLHGAATIGGTAAGLVSGVGELGLLAKGAEAVTGAIGLANNASRAAKVGSAAVKGLIEMSGLAAGDEVSKHILGRGDPETPVASALSNIGAQGLLGAATGGALTLGGMGAGSALKKISNTKVANSMGQFLTDFNNRWTFNKENPSLVDSIYNELKDFHGTTSEVAGDVYGSQGLKTQAIERLTSKTTSEQLTKHVDDVAKIFDKVPREIKSDPLFTTALMDWQEAATKPGATPTDVFKATDLLKRQFQEWGEYNKQFVQIRDVPFRNASKAIGSGLKDSLEDSKVWGDAGTLQKDINKAFSEYVGPLKDFRSKFTSKVDGEHVIDPQKIKTYVNNLGKTGADVTQEIRPQMMKNYVEAADKYRTQINELHAINGLESPLEHLSLDVTKNSYGSTTSGGQLADDLYRDLISKMTTLAGTGVGTAIGYEASHAIGAEAGAAILGTYLGSKLAPFAEKTVGSFTKKQAVPFILKMMESGRPAAWGEALEHAKNIEAGNNGIQLGVDSLFTGGKLAGQRLYSDADQKTKDKINKFISEGGLNQQIKNSLHSPASSAHTPVQQFAEGGVVGHEPSPIKKDANPDIEDSKLSQVYPEHAMLMSQAKGRVYNYLNDLKPHTGPSALPFDEPHKSPERERSYDNALHIADKPLSVLRHIQKGTLEPDHIQHMKQMWPEIYGQLSKKMIQRMSEARLSNEKMPPFHVRQSMSMFLGSPLDSAMTPAGIQAAQAVFSNQKAAMQSVPPTKNKKNTSKLGEMGKEHKTGLQAAESRQILSR